MRARVGAAAILSLATTGCYNLISINLGANHEAGSVGPPLPPEVQCAALAEPHVKMDKVEIDALETCVKAAVEKKQKKAKTP